MSEERGNEAAGRGGATAPRRRASWRGPLALALLLVVVIAAIAASPYWAPRVTPLLPSASAPAPLAGQYGRLSARVGMLEARMRAEATAAARTGRQTAAAIAAVNRSLQGLEKRVGALAAQAPPSPLATGDIARMRRQFAGLQKRVAALAGGHPAPAAGAPPPQISATAQAALDKLAAQVSALESRSASRAQQLRAEIGKLAGQVTRLAAVAAGLADRVPALAAELHAQQGAGEADAALFLGLLQMRQAVEEARPFPQEYSAFLTLVRDWPEIADAARPLAAAAQNGAPSRVALYHQLTALAGKIATAKGPPQKGSWSARLAAEVRALVKIRQVGQPGAPGPAGAVSAAQRALAHNDLKGAVKAIERLSGAHAAAARPWLALAQRRLLAETTLAHLQGLMVRRLVGPPLTPAAPAKTPGNAPISAPKKPGSPS